MLKTTRRKNQVYVKQDELLIISTYLKRTQACLEGIKLGCDDPCKLLYNAMSYLNKIPNSGINLAMYDHLYYSESNEVPQDLLDLAWDTYTVLEEASRRTFYV